MKKTLKDYFNNRYDAFKIQINNDYHMYIDNLSDKICVEICDNSDNSKYIKNFNIDYDNTIDDVKNIVLNWLSNNSLK